MKKALSGPPSKGTAPKKMKSSARPPAGLPSQLANAADAPATIDQALAEALKNQETLVARAEKRVTEWKYATDMMDGAHPLFHHIGYRGFSQWKAADRRWLPAQLEGESLRHGLDKSGQVQLVHQSGRGVILFQRTPEGLDEIVLNGNYSMFIRSRIQDGRTVETGTFRLCYHEYCVETYEYDAEGRCIRSTTLAWCRNDDGSWRLLSVIGACHYEYDEAGLVRAYDQPINSQPRKLMYQRRGAGPVKKKDQSTRTQDAPRRPFVAYTFDEEGPSDEPDYPFYSEAYGLEMIVDDEWPIDTVVLFPPERVEIITGSTELTSRGTVYAGMSFLPKGPALKKAIAADAQWVLIDGETREARKQIATVIRTKLNIILFVGKPDQVSLAFGHGKEPGAKRLVVAFRTAVRVTPAASQKKAKQVREKLREHKAADARVVMACGPRTRNLLSFTSQPDVDGVLILEGNYGLAFDLLSEMATVLDSMSTESD